MAELWFLGGKNPQKTGNGQISFSLGHVQPGRMSIGLSKVICSVVRLLWACMHTLTLAFPVSAVKNIELTTQKVLRTRNCPLFAPERAKRTLLNFTTITGVVVFGFSSWLFQPIWSIFSPVISWDGYNAENVKRRVLLEVRNTDVLIVHSSSSWSVDSPTLMTATTIARH